MTKFEAIERQVADYFRINGNRGTGGGRGWTPAWEARAIARLDAQRALRMRHRRAVLKSGHR